MTQVQDFSKMSQEFNNANAKMWQDAFKVQVELTEKLSHLAFGAAEKANAIGNKWSEDVVAKVFQGVSMKDFANTSKPSMPSMPTELASGNMAVVADLAEVAKSVQTEASELILNAQKAALNDVTQAVRKAAGDVAKMDKKAATASAK